ncbi:MAG: sigma-54 dependent transcriptional regulator [Pseudomonadota bacterium]
MTRETVFFVDDEEHLRIASAQSFELAGISAKCFESADACLAAMADGFDGVLVTDIRMPGMDGVALLHAALERDPELPVILVTGHGDVDLAVRCIKEGAYDFLEKPCEPARLVACVERAFEKRRLMLENRELRAQVGSDNSVEALLNGRSAAISSVRRMVASVAATEADVLITGATGTGKERAARALHKASARAGGPFVLINCAALPDALIESELFGHEAGAFPGATRARFGKFEHARGGVLCLDEIDSLPLELQAKLLHVLQNRTVTRLGSNDQVPLDIRVVALAKGALEGAVAAGTFRADLLYRLNVVTIDLPELATRREDIPGLFTLLTAEAAAKYGLAVPEAPADMLSALSSQDWPGNVRELRNEAERFVLGFVAESERAELTLAEQMAHHERSLISAAIAAHKGSLKDTHEALGLSRKTLYDKMQRYGLTKDDFVQDA